jgi:hypothetical protein
MQFALPLQSVAFAAVCIWLTVRIVNRKERWAKRTLATLLAGVPAVYVASFGPAIWLTQLDDPWAPLTAAIYWPLGRLAKLDGPEVVGNPLAWYAEFFARPYPGLPDLPICFVPVEPTKWGIALTNQEW